MQFKNSLKCVFQGCSLRYSPFHLYFCIFVPIPGPSYPYVPLPQPPRSRPSLPSLPSFLPPCFPSPPFPPRFPFPPLLFSLPSPFSSVFPLSCFPSLFSLPVWFGLVLFQRCGHGSAHVFASCYIFPCSLFAFMPKCLWNPPNFRAVSNAWCIFQFTVRPLFPPFAEPFPQT